MRGRGFSVRADVFLLRDLGGNREEKLSARIGGTDLERFWFRARADAFARSRLWFAPRARAVRDEPFC